MDNRKPYIRPEVDVAELPARCLLLEASNGPADDPLDGIIPTNETALAIYGLF